MSPYQFNPLNYNPLRDVLEKTVDFERLRRETVVKLFLCATNVRTGKVKVFENHELTVSRCCLRRAACRCSSRPLKSTAKPIGTAATWAIRQFSR